MKIEQRKSHLADIQQARSALAAAVAPPADFDAACRAVAIRRACADLAEAIITALIVTDAPPEGAAKKPRRFAVTRRAR
jgi:hypothetical protein